MLMRLACLSGWLALVAVCSARAAEPADSGKVIEPRFFRPSLIYDGTVLGDLRGGVRRGSTYSGNLNLRLYVDPGSRLGISDLYGYVDALWIHGGQPSAHVGDAQGVSNISAASSLQLYEAWVQKSAFGDGLSVLAGLYDVNSEFYRLQTSALFLNSSFGIGPELGQSGVEGPSIFPRTAWGVRATLRPGDYIAVQTAVVNGVPFERPDGSHAVHESNDGALLLAELSVVDRFRRGGQKRNQRFRLGRNAELPVHDNKFAIGVWHYTATFVDLSAANPDGTRLMRHGSSGYYLVGETLLYGPAETSGPRVSGFVQAGYGDATVNRFGSYGGVGLTATGLARDGGSDELGVAVNLARNGSHFKAGQRRDGAPVSTAERTIEISYLAPVSKRLALQPDLQIVHQPNTDPNRKDAVATQLRFEVTY